MNEILILMKKDFMSFLSPLINIKKTIKVRGEKAKLLAMPILFIWLFYAIHKVSTFFYDIYESINQEESVFAVLMVSFTILIVMNIMPYSLSRLYYNRDMETLLHLPIKSRNILKSNFLFLSMGQILIGMILFMPIFIRYENSYNYGISYYLVNILNLAFYSIITVSVVMFLWIFLMSLISRFKRSKNVLQFVFMIAFLALVVGFQQFQNASIRSQHGRLNMDGFARDTIKVIDNILDYLPHLKLFIKPMVDFTFQSGVISLLISMVISLILLNLLSSLSFQPWLNGYNKTQVSNVKKIKAKDIDKHIKYKDSSILMSMIKKELLNIFRTPVYFFNIALGGILVPILLLVPIITQGKFKEVFTNTPDYSALLSMLNIDIYSQIGIVILIGVGLGAFFSLSGSSAMSTISREGKQVWLMQSLPISARDQILSRILASLILFFLESLPITILVGFIIKPPLYLIVFFMLGLMITGFAINSYSMIVDISRPKLIWKNPQGAVKQNFNIFICLLFDFAYIGIHIALSVFLFKNDIVRLDNIHFYALGITIVNLIIGLVFYQLDIKTMKKKIGEYSI